MGRSLLRAEGPHKGSAAVGSGWAEATPWFGFKEQVMESWNGLVWTLKPLLFLPLPWPGTISTGPGCPAWPWALREMGQDQIMLGHVQTALTTEDLRSAFAPAAIPKM